MQLPVEFEQYTRALLGEENYNKLKAGLEETPSVTVRLHPKKGGDIRVPHAPVPWATHAYYLEERPSFTFDPLFHAGCYYVQDASSMFLEQVLKVVATRSEAPLATALDLCAAPGGKSTLLRSLLPEDCLLVANEPMHPRDKVLQENLTKWGYKNTVVTNNYPAAFRPFQNFFDLIVADVPCSGEGMFRKDVQAIEEWSPENVQHCKERQQGIIEDIWPTLKHGGYLIYSTCTFNRAENEENVAWIVKEFGAKVVEVPIQPEWGIAQGTQAGDAPVYHFFPGSTKGEGIFFALLQKPEAEEGASANSFVWSPTESKKKKGKGKERGNEKKKSVDHQLCQTWIKDSETYDWQVKGEQLMALPKQQSNNMQAMQTLLNTLSTGIEVAQLTPKGWQPSHALAMSEALNPEAFQKMEVSYDQALAYLRHESLQTDSQIERGFCMVTYKGMSLGFGKCVGNRINNLYPQEWRIRSGYTTPFELLFL